MLDLFLVLLQSLASTPRSRQALIMRTGKFVRVIESMAQVKLGRHEETIEVWEKDPSVQAFTDLMNRALDKPAERRSSSTSTCGSTGRKSWRFSRAPGS